MRVVLFCPIFKGRRCEAGNLGCSRLRVQNKQTGLSASRPLFRGAPGGRALPTKPSAIQQARIEAIVDRLADLDFFEIGMPGI